MFEIIKNGSTLSLEDKARYVKLQKNGVMILCSEEEAHGIVVNNDYACHLKGRPELPGLDTVTIREFDGAQKLLDVAQEGVQASESAGKAPSATVGTFALAIPDWTPGTTYKQYALVKHNGAVYFIRQPTVTAQAHQPPGSTGLESVYGVRPIPDAYNRYPYVYNMAAGVGMVVVDQGIEYECIQAIDPMLYPPSMIPAHFKRR